jgi:hypothetical protein
MRFVHVPLPNATVFINLIFSPFRQQRKLILDRT